MGRAKAKRGAARGAAPETAARGTAPLARRVLLVHGILGQRHLYWNLFRARLEQEGFVVDEVSLPYSLLGDVRVAADRLAERVETAAAGSLEGKVDLVCHSAGGIVARYYLKFLGGSRRVAHIVFLGSPHRGTYFSYILPVLRIAAQVRPGAELLRELGDDVPPGVAATNFWSPVDGVVIPAQNSILRSPGARNVKVPWMHHWGFLLSPAVHRKVAQALRRKP